MAEIIAEPTALSKVIPLKFKINDVDVPKTTQLSTNKQFNTTDTDAWFTFELDGLAATNGTYDLTLINLDDKSIFHHDHVLFPTLPFHYKLNSSEDVTLNEIRHAGRWLGQLVVTLSNGDTTARQFGFNIAGHILDGQDAQVILLSDYQALINTINLAKDDLAQYNVDYAALLVDIAAAEDARVTAYNQLLADQQANIEAFDVALDEGIVAANLATKLQDFEATNNSRLLSAEQQLAETVKKGDIAITDINKNKGLIDETFLSDEVKQQMLGNTPLHTVPADFSVTLDKTAFVYPKKNIFDKSKAISGFALKTSTGDTVANSGYHVSEYMHIERGEDYAFTEINSAAWYGADKVFISAFLPAPPWNFKSPENAVYMRICMTNVRVNIAQVEKGVSRTSYEPYTLLIHNKYIEPTTVNIEDLTFKKSGKNFFNKSDVVVGILTNAEGIVSSSSTAYRTSDFLKITQGERYAFQKVYKVCWYDASKNFLSVRNLAPAIEGVLQAPTNSAYARITVEVINIDVAQMEKGAEPTAYEPFHYVIDEKYLPVVEPIDLSPIQSNGDDLQAQMAIAERNAHDFIPNTKEPLNIPTYEGSGQTTHPSVLYFENGWNGYKYWMAHTPYPNSNNLYENPSIVASNDNKTWYEPATNPIAPLPEGKGYQSDPTLFMDGNTMEMWYRATTGTLTEIFSKRTTDGVTWTAPELLFDNNTFEIVRSQTVRLKNGKYRMWYTSGTTSNVTLKYAESTDRKNWSGVRYLSVELDSRYTWWHGDVIVDDVSGKVEMIIMCKSNTMPWAVFYTYSYDNVQFTPAMLLINPTVGSLRFDNQQLYRPAFMKVKGEYYVYYSTPSKIALTIGKTIYSLGAEKRDNFPILFPITTVRTANNAYTATDTIDKFPTETITYTKIFGQDGFPTSSGILKTDSVWTESENGRQYFTPSGTDNFYVRRAIASGWSSFKLVTAT